MSQVIIKQLISIIFLVFTVVSTKENDVCGSKYRNIHPEHSMCKNRNGTCRIIGEIEEDRKALLDLHNEIRNSIQLVIGNDYFEGKNMKTMEWDHELYLMALKHALQCTGMPDCSLCHQTDKFHVEQNFAVKAFTSVNQTFNGTVERFKTVINGWAKELRQYDPDIVNRFRFAGLPTNWTNIFRATTYKVGCASAGYHTQEGGNFAEVYICNYGPALLVENEAVYEPSYIKCPSVSDCHANSTFPRNQLPREYKKNISYTFGKSLRREKRDAGRHGEEWCTSDEYPYDYNPCTYEYQGITVDHSFCKRPKMSCQCSRSYERYKKILLDAHNEIRNTVQNYAGWPNGTATNIRVMEWDDELYTIAYRYVSQCHEEPDCYLCHQAKSFSVEQNFAVKVIKNEEDKSGVRFKKVIKEWATELNQYSREYVENLPEDAARSENNHWINVFRARSWKVGCASISFVVSPKSEYSDQLVKEIYLCNYGPAKPYVGEKVFEVGKSCSNCDEGFSCDTHYRNLCSIHEEKPPVLTSAFIEENDVLINDVFTEMETLLSTTTAAASSTTATMKTTTPVPTTIITTTTSTTKPALNITTTISNVTIANALLTTTTILSSAPTTYTVASPSPPTTTNTSLVRPKTITTTLPPADLDVVGSDKLRQSSGEKEPCSLNIIWNCTLRLFDKLACGSEQQCYKAWTLASDGKELYMEIDIPENTRSGLLFPENVYIDRPSCFAFAFRKTQLDSWSFLPSILYGIVMRTDNNENVMVQTDEDLIDWNFLFVDIPWTNAFVQVGVAVKTSVGLGMQHIEVKDFLIYGSPCSAPSVV